MGEKQNQPFQFSFNASLKIDFQGSRVTSDGGLILVRECGCKIWSRGKWVEAVSENSIPRHQAALGQTGKNEPLEARDLAGACSGDKFRCVQGRRSIRCASPNRKFPSARMQRRSCVRPKYSHIS